MTISTGSIRPTVAVVTVLALAVPTQLPAQRDGALSESITERVAAAWGNQPSGVIVKVSDGVVELWGVAPSAAGVDQAEEIARNTYGVREVVNRLSVRQPRVDGQVARQQQEQQAAVGR